MEYFYNDEHEVKVRIDLEKNQAFVKTRDSDVETLAPKGSKVVADTTIENNQITKEQYEAK